MSTLLLSANAVMKDLVFDWRRLVGHVYIMQKNFVMKTMVWQKMSFDILNSQCFNLKLLYPIIPWENQLAIFSSKGMLSLQVAKYFSFSYVIIEKKSKAAKVNVAKLLDWRLLSDKPGKIENIRNKRLRSFFLALSNGC